MADTVETEFALAAAPRTPGHPRRDRREGYVPAVVYGHGVPSRAVRVEARALDTLLHRGGAHHLVRLTLQGEPEPRTVVIKEIQRHPVTRQVRHVDFQAVAAHERIHAEVPLRLRGEEQVAKTGGLLQVLLHTLRVSCLPADLPDHIEVAVGDLTIGQTVTVGDLTVPAGVTLEHDPGEAVAHVLAPRTAATEEGAAPAGGAPQAAPSSPQ